MTNGADELQKLHEALSMRVLVSVSDGQPRMTCVRGFSPAGQFVWLAPASTDSRDDENVGWQHVARVRVLEVLGSSTASMVQVAEVVQAIAPVALTTASATT